MRVVDRRIPLRLVIERVALFNPDEQPRGTERFKLQEFAARRVKLDVCQGVNAADSFYFDFGEVQGHVLADVAEVVASGLGTVC